MYKRQLLERHRRTIELLRERSESRGGVVFFDISDLDLEGYNKFIPYLLHPEALYTVGVSSSATRAKISLGSNPWKDEAAGQNLASLAEAHGGGGHPRVAAISLAPGEDVYKRQPQIDEDKTEAQSFAAAINGDITSFDVRKATTYLEDLVGRNR